MMELGTKHITRGPKSLTQVKVRNMPNLRGFGVWVRQREHMMRLGAIVVVIQGVLRETLG